MNALTQRIDGIEAEMRARFKDGDERMGRMETKLDANSAATEEVREIVVMGKSFFKVLGHLGNGIKWLVSVGAAIAGAYYAWLNWLRS